MTDIDTQDVEAPKQEVPEQEATDEVVVPEMPKKMTRKHKGGRGASKEWMQAMTARRQEMAKLSPEHQGGRARTRYSRREIEERALERMMPRALKVLEEQLSSPDDRVRQAAAVKVMEYVKGKPTQNVRSQVDQVSRIVYESAAWRPTADGEVIEGGEVRELPPADNE